MSEKKTIQINPDLFKVSKQTRKKKEPADGNSSGVAPKLKVKDAHSNKHNKTTKTQILKYIRQQQQQKYDDMLKHSAKKHDATHTREDLIDNFENDFKESLNFLNAMSEKTQNKIHRPSWNSTLKNTNSVLMQPSVMNHVLSPASTPTSPTSSFITDENVNTIVPDLFSHPQRVLLPSPQPQYGCLKGGQLPTYRTWNTAKNRTSIQQPLPNYENNSVTHVAQPIVEVAGIPQQEHSIIPPPIQHNNTVTVSETQTEPSSTVPSILERLKNPVWLKNTGSSKKIGGGEFNTKQAIERKMRELQSQNNYRPQRRQRKTMRRTFVLGKSKHYPKIGVLVSNKTLRKQIGTRNQQLKQIPIDEVRKTLIKKGLIKVGSTAPNDVLRKMYETLNMMCGDLHNHNPDNLIYNYMAGGL